MRHKGTEHLSQAEVKQNSLLAGHCKAKSYCYPNLLSTALMNHHIASGDQQQCGTMQPDTDKAC